MGSEMCIRDRKLRVHQVPATFTQPLSKSARNMCPSRPSHLSSSSSGRNEPSWRPWSTNNRTGKHEVQDTQQQDTQDTRQNTQQSLQSQRNTVPWRPKKCTSSSSVRSGPYSSASSTNCSTVKNEVEVVLLFQGEQVTVTVPKRISYAEIEAYIIKTFTTPEQVLYVDEFRISRNGVPWKPGTSYSLIAADIIVACYKRVVAGVFLKAC